MEPKFKLKILSFPLLLSVLENKTWLWARPNLIFPSLCPSADKSSVSPSEMATSLSAWVSLSSKWKKVLSSELMLLKSLSKRTLRGKVRLIPTWSLLWSNNKSKRNKRQPWLRPRNKPTLKLLLESLRSSSPVVSSRKRNLRPKAQWKLSSLLKFKNLKMVSGNRNRPMRTQPNNWAFKTKRCITWTALSKNSLERMPRKKRKSKSSSRSLWRL